MVLPGGFAHGDYLRPGALARFSPVMAAVARFAADGGPVVGICNGFQVLTEAGLLPGALQKNRRLRFLCTPVAVAGQPRPARCSPGTCRSAPACASRSTTSRAATSATEATLAELRAEDRVVLRYIDNPNGSVDDIAGIGNAAGNVVGLMPHPERAVDDLLGSTDGAVLLGALLGVGRRRPRRLSAGSAVSRSVSPGCGRCRPSGGPPRSPRRSARCRS